jgi:hypothetical protein
MMRKLKVNREDAKKQRSKLITKKQKGTHTYIHKHTKKEERSLQHQFPCVIQQSIEI